MTRRCTWGRWGLALALSLAWLLPVGATDAQAAPAAGQGCPPAAPASEPLGAPSTTGSLQPPVEELLACVGAQAITGATFEHWATIAEKSEGHADANEVLQQTMGFLITAVWVTGEASDLNIHISEEEVRRTFDRIRREEFPKRREFAAFMRSTGQTVADLLLRVRLNLSSARIQKRVVAGHHGAKAQQRAMARFVTVFKRKWQAQTYCVQDYAGPDCGHVQASI
jgi:hypothetical protein